MAYFNQEEDENKDNSQGMNSQAEPQGSAPVQLSNQSASTSPAAPKAAPAAKPASSGSSPSFANYAKANQGKAQNSLNSAVAQNVQNAGQTATNAINQATTAFGTKVDQGSLQNRQNALQDISDTIAAARNTTAAPKAAAPVQSNFNPVNPNGTQGPKTIKSGMTASGQVIGQAPAESAPTPAAPAAQPTTPNYGGVNEQQQKRFQEIINAKYGGPESLRQSGLYNPASEKVGIAQNKLDNSKTATGREELLKSMYQQKGDYTAGLNKLDSALLNASKQGVQNLQNVAQAQGNLGQNLDKAQVSSANLSQNRANEIKDIQNKARNTFTEGKKAEEAATEARLSSVIKDWDKLPEYFRDIIRNKEANNKTAYDQQVADYSTKNKGADPAALAKAQADLKAAQTFRPAGVTSTYLINQARAKKVKQAQEALNPLLAQQKAYDDGLANLKNGYNPNALNLNAEEASILGINSGEGLYNLGADAIKTAAYDKEKLISRDEQARQSALAQLAGLDLSKQLDTNLLYNNADKAGTQSALDALDLAGTRAGLNAAEKNFQDYAENADITGTGSKKNKTNGKTYRATQSANVGDILKNAGYNFDANKNNVGNSDLLNSIANISRGQDLSLGSELRELKPDLSASTVGNALSPYTDNTNLATKAAYGMADAGSLGITAGLRGLGLDTTGAILGGIDGLTSAVGLGSVFGGGANTAASKDKAKSDAIKDLQNKVKESLNSQGFDNRFNVQNNDVTTSRTAALQQLLANLDKTNG
jgi:hypothetical protein